MIFALDILIDIKPHSRAEAGVGFCEKIREEIGIVDMTGSVPRKIYEIHTRELIRDDIEEALIVMLFDEHLFKLFVHLALSAAIAFAHIIRRLVAAHLRLRRRDELFDVALAGAGFDADGDLVALLLQLLTGLRDDPRHLLPGLMDARDHVLVAADAVNPLVGAVGLQRVGDAAEHVVALLMAEVVVHLVQAVDVDVQHG